MPQKSRPVSVVTTGSWGPTPIFPQVNLPVPDDVHLVASKPSVNGDNFTVNLAGLAYPSPGDQTLTVRLRHFGGSSTIVTVVLWEGNNFIVGQNFTTTGTFTNCVVNVPPGVITNYANLQVQVLTPIKVDCCSNPIAALLTASFSGATGTCGCLNDLAISVVNANRSNIWLRQGISACSHTGVTHTISCINDVILGLVWTSTGLAQGVTPIAGANCSPLSIPFPGATGSICTGTVDETVTGPAVGVTVPSVQVSWIQLQIPVHCPGAPTNPLNPLFGQRGGCGCGCGCAECGAPPPGPQAPDAAINPVRYANGEIVLSATDVHSSGSGFSWGHTRSYTNQLTENTNAGNGYNWQIKEWPYLVIEDDGDVLAMGTVHNVPWFNSAGVPHFSVRESLALDQANNVWNLNHLDGSVTQFNGVTGAFIKHADTAGNTIAVVGYTLNNFNFTEVQRSTTSGGVTTIESFAYSYVDSTRPFPLLSSVTLSRKVGSGAWTNVTRALYTYYSVGDAFGGDSDLRTVELQTADGNSWASTGTTLYRYWGGGGSSSSSGSSASSGSSGSAGGATHMLKYVVKPASYVRLAAVANPLTAPNSLVAQFADNYFEYDAQNRVTRESVNGGSQSFQYAFTLSTNANGYNNWSFKCTETRPDGSQYIVYCNYAGQAMLRVLKNGSDQWCDFYQYDAATADLVLYARPSAVASFSEASAGLVTLNASTGLILTYQFDQPTGYLTAELVQKGKSGTAILVRSYQYTTCNPCASSSSSSSSSGSSGSTCTGPPVSTFPK